MLAWWPNMELQAILLQIFTMINEGVQNLKTYGGIKNATIMQVNIVQENNIAHSEFYKFMEIF